jgi:hypothetical protein
MLLGVPGVSSQCLVVAKFELSSLGGLLGILMLLYVVCLSLERVMMLIERTLSRLIFGGKI